MYVYRGLVNFSVYIITLCDGDVFNDLSRRSVGMLLCEYRYQDV